MRYSIATTTLSTASLLVAATAHAQAVDVAAAQAAFRVGAQAFKANQFDVAAKSFEQAYEFDPRPETAFSIAQANRRQYYFDKQPWRLARAVQLYQAYLTKLPKGPRANDAIDRLGEIEPLLRELKARGELQPYSPPIKTELVVGAEVEKADVTVDGAAVQLWDPVSVTPGAHEITLAAPGYELERRRVVIAEGRFVPIDMALRPKPARLDVHTEAGATLFIDGRRIGGLPRPQMSVVAGNHYVSVTRRGREPFNQEINLQRDQAFRLDAPLQVTAQRRAAQYVLLGAATVGLGSIGFATAAWVAHDDAKSLDAKRQRGEASAADLQAYNQRVADIDRRTNIAIGVGVSAAVIGAIGVGLYWFDESSPGLSPKVVSPVIGSESVGVSFSGGF
ncbi:MAG TPA: PEGA domain-containing protein [Kofleriaceae bacterium]|nr:PEGA domain-containing protein [Kofleriaceae bacterium]